jgi:hypothetical protein
MPTNFKPEAAPHIDSLLSLPTELRLQIFEYIISPALIPRIALTDPDQRHPYVMDFIEAADCLRILRCLRVTCRIIRFETDALQRRMLEARYDEGTYLYVLPQSYFEMDLKYLLSFSSTFDDAWKVVKFETRAWTS